MTRGDFLLIALFLLVLAGFVLLLWRDIVNPRKERQLRRQERRDTRRRARIRSWIFTDMWKLRRTRRLTDQSGRDSQA